MRRERGDERAPPPCKVERLFVQRSLTVARPPVATERLSRLDDGRLLYRLKHRWRDGTTHVVFEPQELIEKLAALVPAPRIHLVRYHGILGPCAGRRGHVVPCKEAQARREGPQPLSGPGGAPVASLDEDAMAETRRSSEIATRPQADRVPDGSAAANTTRIDAEPSLEAGGTPARRRRLAWAHLLRRVFAVDVLECPRCGGRMRLLATIHRPDATQAILECLRLPSRAPPVAAPQSETAGLELGADEFEASA